MATAWGRHHALSSVACDCVENIMILAPENVNANTDICGHRFILLRQRIEQGFYSDWDEFDHIVAQTERWPLDLVRNAPTWKSELRDLMVKHGVFIEWS